MGTYTWMDGVQPEASKHILLLCSYHPHGGIWLVTIRFLIGVLQMCVL